MQVARETHVILEAEEIQQRLAAALGTAIGARVGVDIVANLVDDEDDYRYRGTVTFEVAEEHLGSLAAKLGELSEYGDTEEEVLEGNGIRLEAALIREALGLPIVYWCLTDVGRHMGDFMLDVVVAREDVAEDLEALRIAVGSGK